jgi:hypothetical protein
MSAVGISDLTAVADFFGARDFFGPVDFRRGFRLSIFGGTGAAAGFIFVFFGTTQFPFELNRFTAGCGLRKWFSTFP